MENGLHCENKVWIDTGESVNLDWKIITNLFSLTYNWKLALRSITNVDDVYI